MAELISTSERARVFATDRGILKEHHDERAAQNERDILARIRSARVVRMIPGDEAPSQLLLEPIPDAEPLSRRIARAKLSISETTAVALGLVRALSEVHAAHVVHRGLSPDNVLVAPDLSEIVLCGFGAATLETAEGSRSSSNIRTARIEFTAPELLVGSDRWVDYRADYFALGVLLYELLTGELPFAEDRAATHAHRFHSQLVRTPRAPHELCANIPPALSRLVMRLLAKSPEDRYQSATAIAADLQPNPAALADRGERLELSGGYYGRFAERQGILQIFAAATQSVVTLEGPSGIGKSALVDALAPDIRARGAHIARGKFDQLRRARPYGALSDALRGLAAEVLAEAGDRHGELVRELRSRLAGEAPWLLLAIPETKSIFDSGRAAPRASAAETQARIGHALARYVATIGELTGRVVLFLDDVHWADQATLDALPMIAGERSVLPVLAFRSNEVDATSAISLALGVLARRGIALHRVELGPLGAEDSEALVCAAVEDAPGCEELARVVAQRTEGNPLLETQFLLALGREGLIYRDASTRAWTWSVDAVKSFVSSEGVAAVIARQLTKLPEETQRLLAVASCLGPTFELADLARVENSPIERVQNALAEGFLVALPGARLRFLHDRIEQAARARVEDRAAALHADIARSLFESNLEGERLHAIASHARAGVEHLRPGEEARKFLELVVLAGETAQASAGYRTAIENFACADQLAPRAQLEETRSHRIASALAECSHALGDAEAFERHLEHALATAQAPLDRARTLALRVNHAALGHRHDRAIDVALEGLALLGIRLGRRPAQARVVAGLLSTQWKLSRRTDPEIEELPLMEDETARVALDLISSVMGSAYQVADQGLFACCTFEALELILRHGHTPTTAFNFVTYGMLRIAALRDYRGGQRYGDLGLRIADRHGDGTTRCRSVVVHHLFIHHWGRDWRLARAEMMRAHTVGAQAGEMTYAGYAFGALLNEFSMGTPLAEVAELAESGEQFTRRAGDVGATSFTRDLRGLYGSMNSSSPEAFAAAAVMNSEDYLRLERTWRYWWNGHRLVVAVIMEDDRIAAEALAAAGEMADAGVCSWNEAILPAYRTIHLTRRWAKTTRSERRAVRRGIQFLRSWEKTCPENGTPYRALAEGAFARARGDHERAMSLFETAIEAGHRGSHRPAIVLAARLAAELAHERGHATIAAAFAELSARAATEWGALEPARRVRARFGAFLPAEPHSSPIAGTDLDRVGVDALTLSLQALSGELTLDRLVAKLLETVILSAGATRGYLYRRRDSGWTLLARGQLGRDGREVVVERPQLEPPLSLLRYAAHSGAPIVLDDAIADGTFGRDPHVLEEKPRSLVLLPVARNGEMTAALLLENEHVRGAFQRARVDMLSLLSGQIGISLENAELYGKMERAVETAQAAARAKAVFLAGVSHELRTPLNAIHGTVDLLSKLPLQGEQRELVSILGSGSEALLKSIGALVEYTEAESGEVTLEDVAFELARLVEGTTSNHRAAAAKKGLALILEAPPSMLSGDSVRFARVVDHLLSNAVKFTERGSIAVRASVRPFDEDRSRARVELTVEDTGSGISAEELGSAFDPLAGRAGGFGVGLAYVKRSVELMGGTVVLESRAGHGTRVSISLPFRMLERSEAAPLRPHPIVHRPVILAAEDNRVNQMVLAKIVRSLGYELVLCANGAEAVAKYAELDGNIFCVLMDCQMPEMDGFEAAVRIRAHEKNTRGPRVPIIAVTANVLSCDRDKCLHAGMDDYVPKPVRAAVLGEAITRWSTPTPTLGPRKESV